MTMNPRVETGEAKICENCKYYRPIDSDEVNDFGECHYNPPVYFDRNPRTGLHDEPNGVWPEVWGDHWCGKFDKLMTRKDYIAEYQATCSHQWEHFKNPAGKHMNVCRHCRLELELP